jgi:hypothetical protein
MRVLLIEDDSAAARSIDLMLKSETFNVYTTDLGEEGKGLLPRIPDLAGDPPWSGGGEHVRAVVAGEAGKIVQVRGRDAG